MTEFVASNGLRVTSLSDGQVSLRRSLPADSREYVVWMGGGEASALREFFQAERDSDLGRWRSKKLPQFVVYPSQEKADHERAFGAGLDCVILRETDGAMKGYVAAEDEWPEGRGGGNEWRLVGREYAAAHPEPKPWHDAKPGEVWALKCTGLEFAASIRDGQWRSADHGGVVLAENITAGRRIWPEVSQ